MTVTGALGVSVSQRFDLVTPQLGVTLVWVLAAHKGILGMPSKGPQANWQKKANTGLTLKKPASVTFPHGPPEAGAAGQAQGRHIDLEARAGWPNIPDAGTIGLCPGCRTHIWSNWENLDKPGLGPLIISPKFNLGFVL